MPSPRDAPILRLRAPGRPPKCGGCGTGIVVISRLIGWHDDHPLCPDCLLHESPELGWALHLVERSATDMAGWPAKPESRRLSLYLRLLRTVGRVLGPIQPQNPRLPLALDLLQVLSRHDHR